MPYISKCVWAPQAIDKKAAAFMGKNTLLTFLFFKHKVKSSLACFFFGLHFNALDSKLFRHRLKVKVNTGLNTLGNTVPDSQTILQSQSMQSLTQLHMRSVHMVLCMFPVWLFREQLGRKSEFMWFYTSWTVWIVSWRLLFSSPWAIIN